LRGAFLIVLAAATLAQAQTPPIKPQTPDVKVPPPVELAGPPVADPDASGRAITASEAVAIALRRQPSVTIAGADVRAAQGRVRQSESGLLPQFGVGAGVTEQGRIRGGSSGATNRFNTNLTVDQLLFDFERTRDTVRQQSALLRATRRAFAGTEQQVALQVKTAFYNYAENIRLLKVSEDNLANRQRQLDLANARLNEGVGAPGDVVRAKTNMADSVISLTTARNAVTRSRVTLAELMGIDPRTPINPAPAEEPDVAGEVNALVETALRQRPDLLEAQERVTAARFAVSVARKTNVPRIDLSGVLNARGVNDPGETQVGTVGINVRWTFGDGGLTAGRTQEARAEEEAARAFLLQVSQQVVSDVSIAYVDLRSAEQRVETAEVQVANARELLRISEGRYGGGIGTFLEVTDAQASLVSAERNLANAQADVQRARAALNRAVGTAVR
jgi:outer membrane protein